MLFFFHWFNFFSSLWWPRAPEEEHHNLAPIQVLQWKFMEPPHRLDSSSIHGVSLMSEGSEALGDVSFWLTEEEVMYDELACLEIDMEWKRKDLMRKRVHVMFQHFFFTFRIFTGNTNPNLNEIYIKWDFI